MVNAIRASRCFLLPAVLLLLAACQAPQGPKAPLFDQAASSEVLRRPAWYTRGDSRGFLVKYADKPVGVLWGTLHIGYSDDTILPQPIRAMFYEASDLTVEIALDRLSPVDQRYARQARDRAMNSPDPAALARLEPQVRASLDDLPSGSTGHLSLMGLAGLVSQRALARPVGPMPQVGFVDLNLISFARGREIPVYGLERLQAQIEPIFSEPNGSRAAAALRRVLRQRDDLRDLMEWATSEYGKGHVAKAVAALTAWKADQDDLTQADLQRGTLLTARNLAWIPRLNARFAKPGLHFVAFGAGHLLGEDGVPALLTREGYAVIPCANDRCPGF